MFSLPALSNSRVISTNCGDNQAESQNISTKAPNASFFQQLIEKGVIDSDGKVKEEYDKEISFTLTAASGKQIDSLLKKRFSEELDLTIADLLEMLKKRAGTSKVEVIGGFVRWLCTHHPKEILAAFQQADVNEIVLPKIEARYPPDYDIRCSDKEIKENDFVWLADDLIKDLAEISGKENLRKRVFKKLKENHFDGVNHLHTLTFKNGNKPELELIINRLMNRKYLFTQDAIRIDITDQYTLHSPLGLQPFIDLLIRIIRVPAPEKVDHGGWPAMISYLTRGYTTPCKKVEKILLDQTRKKGLIKELQKCIKNHHRKDPEAQEALWLNACFSEEGLWSKKKVPEGKGLLFVLLKMDSLQEVKDLLQVAGFISLCTPGVDSRFRLVSCWGESALQVWFGKATLILPFNPIEALKSFKQTPLLKKLVPKVKLNSKEEPPLKSFTFPETESLLLQSLEVILNPTKENALSLLKRFPEADFELPYIQLAVQRSPFGVVPELCSKKFTSDEWILHLAETQDADLCGLAYTLWFEKRETCSEDFSLRLIRKLIPRDDHSAIKICDHLVKKGDLSEKVATAILNTVQANNPLAEKVLESLLKNRLPKAIQLLTDKNREFFRKIPYLIECLKKLSGTENLAIFKLLEILLPIVFRNGDAAQKREAAKELLVTFKSLEKNHFILSERLKGLVKIYLPNILESLEPLEVREMVHTLVSINILIDLEVSEMFIKSLPHLDDFENIRASVCLFNQQNRNAPLIPTDSLSAFIKNWAKSTSDHKNIRRFFNQDVPQIYKNDYRTQFRETVAELIDQNVSFPLLKQYRIPKSHLWRLYFEGNEKNLWKTLLDVEKDHLLDDSKEDRAACWVRAIESINYKKGADYLNFMEKLSSTQFSKVVDPQQQVVLEKELLVKCLACYGKNIPSQKVMIQLLNYVNRLFDPLLEENCEKELVMICASVLRGTRHHTKTVRFPPGTYDTFLINIKNFMDKVQDLEVPSEMLEEALFQLVYSGSFHVTQTPYHFLVKDDIEKYVSEKALREVWGTVILGNLNYNFNHPNMESRIYATELFALHREMLPKDGEVAVNCYLLAIRMLTRLKITEKDFDSSLLAELLSESYENHLASLVELFSFSPENEELINKIRHEIVEQLRTILIKYPDKHEKILQDLNLFFYGRHKLKKETFVDLVTDLFEMILKTSPTLDTKKKVLEWVLIAGIDAKDPFAASFILENSVCAYLTILDTLFRLGEVGDLLTSISIMSQLGPRMITSIPDHFVKLFRTLLNKVQEKPELILRKDLFFCLRIYQAFLKIDQSIPDATLTSKQIDCLLKIRNMIEKSYVDVCSKLMTPTHPIFTLFVEKNDHYSFIWQRLFEFNNLQMFNLEYTFQKGLLMKIFPLIIQDLPNKKEQILELVYGIITKTGSGHEIKSTPHDDKKLELVRVLYHQNRAILLVQWIKKLKESGYVDVARSQLEKGLKDMIFENQGAYLKKALELFQPKKKKARRRRRKKMK